MIVDEYNLLSGFMGYVDLIQCCFCIQKFGSIALEANDEHVVLYAYNLLGLQNWCTKVDIE